MSEPGVSIIIPTYNYGHFLVRCVEAALTQTVRPLEVIVVDDGSTDNTPEIMRSYEEKVNYVRQKNQGLSGARNTGANLARGDSFIFCDSDDYLVPQAIEFLTAAVSNDSTGVVYGKCLECYEDGRTGAIKGNHSAAGCPPIPAKANFWKSLIATTGAALIRRRTFDRVGGYIMPTQEDRDFWIKAGMLEPFVFCDQVVLNKSTRNDSIISHKGRQIYWSAVVQLDFLDWCRKRGLDSSPLRISPRDITENAVKYLVRGGHIQYLWRGLNEMKRRGLPRPSVTRAVLRDGVPEWIHQAKMALLKKSIP